MLEQLKQLQNFQGNFNTGGNGNSDVDVVTRSAQNIEDEEATLRGEVDFNNEDEATVYFQYGRSSSNLNEETVQKVLDEDDDDEKFTQKLTDLRDDTKYYYRAVAEDEKGRRDFGSIVSFTTDDDNNRSSSNDDEPDADVDNADDITDDSAELSGEVDMNDFRNGIVFFVYGEDEDQVEDVEKDYDEYTDVDTDGDDLQKRRVDTDLDNKDDYTINIGGLNDDTDVFFAIYVEYEDNDDDQVLTCSSIEDFTTDDNGGSNNNGDDEPEADTGDATSVTDDSARIHGEVDMNDFNNGLVFFVYGEDEDQVDEIADEYDEYTDVDEDGDDLQKIKVDSDLDDNNADYTAFFNGLDNDTDIYYSICVEYEDEDDDLVILCGGTEDFTTDN